MRKRRREEEREPERSGKHQLARLDTTTRVGVLEQLQRASGNRALQEVVAGAQLQRDTTTTTKPTKGSVRRASTSEWLLSLGGTLVGPVESVEGLAVRADVITQGGGDVQRKHVGRAEHEPGVLKVGLGMDKSFYQWVAAWLDKHHGERDLILHHVDPATGEETSRLELSQVLLTALELPKLDATSKDSALKVTIVAEQVQRRIGPGQKLETKGTDDPLSPSTMRFEVDGIGVISGLKSIGPWTFKRQVAEDFHQHKLTKAESGNLILTLAEGAGASALDAWAEASMVKGISDENAEKTAVLTVSSKGGRKLELTFYGVGIFSAERVARSGAGGRQYGLYVERAKLAVN